MSIKAFKLFLKWFEGLRTENVTVMQLVKPCLCLWAPNTGGLIYISGWIFVLEAEYIE